VEQEHQEDLHFLVDKEHQEDQVEELNFQDQEQHLQELLQELREELVILVDLLQLKVLQEEGLFDFQMLVLMDTLQAVVEQVQWEEALILLLILQVLVEQEKLHL
jgi:hypothetical protein